jgi:hypothetical protein
MIERRFYFADTTASSIRADPRLRWEQQNIEESASLALSGGRSSISPPQPHHKAKPDRRPGMFVRIKEFTIYLPVNTAVTIVVTGEEKPKVEQQDDHWEDERQQMFDDYD